MIKESSTHSRNSHGLLGDMALLPEIIKKPKGKWSAMVLVTLWLRSATDLPKINKSSKYS